MDLAAAEIFNTLCHPHDRDWPDDNKLNRAIQRDFPSLPVARLLDNPDFLVLRSIWLAKDRHLRRVADPEARSYAVEWLVGVGPLIDCYLEWMKDADGGMREAFVTMRDMMKSLVSLLGVLQKSYGEMGVSLKERLMNCVYGIDEDAGHLDSGTKTTDETTHENQYQSDGNWPSWHVADEVTSNADSFIKEGQAKGSAITTIPTRNETSAFENNLECLTTTAVSMWDGMQGSRIDTKRCTLNTECSEATTMLAYQNFYSEATESYSTSVSSQQTETIDVRTTFTQTETIHPLCGDFLSMDVSMDVSMDGMPSDVMIKSFDGCFKGKWNQPIMCSSTQNHMGIGFSDSPRNLTDLQSQPADNSDLLLSCEGSFVSQAPTFSIECLRQQDCFGTQPVCTQFDAQMNWITHNQGNSTAAFGQPPFLQALPISSSVFEQPSFISSLPLVPEHVDSSSPPPKLTQKSSLEQQEWYYHDAHDLKDIKPKSVGKRLQIQILADDHVPATDQVPSLSSVRARPRSQPHSGRAHRSSADQTTYQLPQIMSVGPVRRTNRSRTSYESWLDDYLTTVFFDLEGGILSKQLRKQVLAATGLHTRKLTYWFSNHRARLQKALRMYKEAKKRWPEKVYDYKSYKEWTEGEIEKSG